MDAEIWTQRQRKDLDTETEERRSCDREGRDWSDASKIRMGRIPWKLKKKGSLLP